MATPTKAELFSQNAGWKDARRNPHTGGWTGIYLSEAQGLEGEDKWAVICEAHGTLVTVPNLRFAEITAADSTSFCEDCREIEGGARACSGCGAVITAEMIEGYRQGNNPDAMPVECPACYNARKRGEP